MNINMEKYTIESENGEKKVIFSYITYWKKYFFIKKNNKRIFKEYIMVFNRPYTGLFHEQVEFEHTLNENDQLENQYCEICKKKIKDACNYYENGLLVGW